MKKLIYLFLVITIVACGGKNSSNDSGNAGNDNSTGDNPVYLDANGITIKAREWAEVGAMGEINGVTYTVVDYSTLLHMVENGDDVTKLATTKVTKMSFLFWGDSFNQDIGNWDVSSVTDMRWMFSESSFNQDLSHWDVSNVNDMNGMFRINLNFNQDISNWDVSSVTDMRWMFSESSFNQDLSNWDVSNVTGMNGMFRINLNFNQDISKWDVSNVVLCYEFSHNTVGWTLPKPNFTNCTP